MQRHRSRRARRPATSQAAATSARTGRAADRRDPVEILVEQGADGQADLLLIRYGRMAASPFAFLRGAAAVWRPTSRPRRSPASVRR